MELPIKPQSSLVNQIVSFFQAFQDTLAEEKEFIMPIYQVQKILHTHYVNRQPLDITFEFYDDTNQIQLTTARSYVLSPVQTDQSISLELCSNQTIYSLDTQQILTVSANAV